MNETDNKIEDSQCPYVDSCVFLRENRTKMPELIARIQADYCTNPACCRCARFRISQSLGLDKVPALMLPDQIDWARQIVQEFGGDLETDGQLAEAQ
jgi:hypothetical protein